MGGYANVGSAHGLGARADRGRVVVEIGRDVELVYNPAAWAIELSVEPASAQAFASALMEAAESALESGG